MIPSDVTILSFRACMIQFGTIFSRKAPPVKKKKITSQKDSAAHPATFIGFFSRLLFLVRMAFEFVTVMLFFGIDLVEERIPL